MMYLWVSPWLGARGIAAPAPASAIPRPPSHLVSIRYSSSAPSPAPFLSVGPAEPSYKVNHCQYEDTHSYHEYHAPVEPLCACIPLIVALVSR
ncbi:hypothetical protein F4604DRAFT_538183 [Suillus subluteus]|nr:hypothetical protein F4604DRAFT_538183 [Suillus subluteus]